MSPYGTKQVANLLENWFRDHSGLHQRDTQQSGRTNAGSVRGMADITAAVRDVRKSGGMYGYCTRLLSRNPNLFLAT